ncbi:MAG: hypothetical protein K6E95_00680 [Lachnospiraceae bacterium]|nr:hypothetical protein [Lachnospiraceae bacterium]
MSKIFNSMKAKVTDAMIRTKVALSKKREGIDGIVVAVGLIIVVVAVLLIFKDKIYATVESLLNGAKTDLDSLNGGISHSTP